MKLVAPLRFAVPSASASEAQAPVFRAIEDEARDTRPDLAGAERQGADRCAHGGGDDAPAKATTTAAAAAADDTVRFERAMAYLRQHFRTATLGDLAKLAGLSPFHFHRRFAQWAGRTPKAIATELQIAHAKALLAEGRLRLRDVAAACGFANQAHFTNRFGKFVGTTPLRYRRARAVEALVAAERAADPARAAA